MSPRLRSILIKSGGFLLAALLLFLAFRGSDFREIWIAFAEADYRWLLPVIVVLLGSHVLRAWRWVLFLRALPPEESDGRAPTVRAAFYSLMIGYMVNYAAPRLGEVARTVNLASRTRMPVSSVLGTVVAERVLDMVMLLVAIASVVILLWERLGIIQEMIVTPLGSASGWWILGVTVLIVVVGVLLLATFRRLIRTRPDIAMIRWTARLKPAYRSFSDGFATIRRSPQRLLIATLTVSMWFCYALAANIPFVMLSMDVQYALNLIDSWSIMVLGSLGVVVPSPGGTGSYHYITVETLVRLFDVDRSPAASYAFLTHAAQFIIYVITGAICMLLQASRPRDFLALDSESVESQSL